MSYGTAGTSKHGYGTIFSLTTSGRYENVHTFLTGREGGPGVIWSYRGALYGTTDGEYVGKQHFTFYRGAFFEMRLPHDFRVITRLGDLLDRPGALLPIDGAFYLRMATAPIRTATSTNSRCLATCRCCVGSSCSTGTTTGSITASD